jgi:predicted ATPase
MSVMLMTFAGAALATSILALAAFVHERRARLALERRLDTVERDHRAALGAQAQAGDRLLEVERQVRTLVHGQTQLEMKAPVGESYRHAITLVERGASTDELVSRCGLARGEAELVHLIHAASSGGRAAA